MGKKHLFHFFWSHRQKGAKRVGEGEKSTKEGKGKEAPAMRAGVFCNPPTIF